MSTLFYRPFLFKVFPAYTCLCAQHFHKRDLTGHTYKSQWSHFSEPFWATLRKTDSKMDLALVLADGTMLLCQHIVGRLNIKADQLSRKSQV